MNAASSVRADIEALHNAETAAFSQRFFRTEAGGYGEGDRFLGVRVPLIRRVVRKYYQGLSIRDIRTLLSSQWHEVRLAGALAIAAQYSKAGEGLQRALFELYVDQLGVGLNSWDIIDVTAPTVLGAYVARHDGDRLEHLAAGGLWQKRAALVATLYFLRRGEPGHTQRLAEAMVSEEDDLLQKAVGWVLREMGKVDARLLEHFLREHAPTMPRTMLRYAIERLPEDQRRQYLSVRPRTKRRMSARRPA
ncbi:MAG: DNA alkylation repair protein [Candidatus Dormibacteraeota bacterium]|uniref:DNA alkylation repair protein n=1 Tax=Candidatus Dormiibacter inghamiae TaxID=3127013 RepID=A0A934KI66_9BACT|nr:DNA alkylation repair protein [Candidatus Dormibacteraeota bacterium]MBJ7607596.1 DNA alkylation repair protein [Candidatus Dormibacteraeota bacterium]